MASVGIVWAEREVRPLGAGVQMTVPTLKNTDKDSIIL